MVKRTILALIAASGAAPVACAWADLGPEATLRDASTGDDTADTGPGIVDVSSEPEASQYKCGLPPDPNATCNACNEQHCCDLGVQCGQDPRCLGGINCSLDCVYDPACIAHCDDVYGDAGVFLTLEKCAISQCVNACVPGPECLTLAKCCPLLVDVTEARVCIGTVDSLDEGNCQNLLDNVLRPQLGADFCGGPGDGGKD
jgi:hypothetical protein